MKHDSHRIISRIFLDSSTLQTLQDYGEFIYDGMHLDPTARILRIPDGAANLQALRSLTMLAQRAGIELALSANSLREVEQKGDLSYLQWALEILDYWEQCLSLHYPPGVPFTGKGVELAATITRHRFGYISEKDLRLLQDAVSLECDAFLTMERRLPRNRNHLEREIGIVVAQPAALWNII